MPKQTTIFDSSPDWLIIINRLITTEQHGDWCRIPYPGHKHGCPKYGKPGCPPEAPRIESVIDMSRPMFFVHSEFSLWRHMAIMKAWHPLWSQRQLRNVLYWQNTSRKQLRDRVTQIRREVGTAVALYCPEGHGVNVYATALKNGLRLERIRNLKICRHVALLGFKP